MFTFCLAQDNVTHVYSFAGQSLPSCSIVSCDSASSVQVKMRGTAARVHHGAWCEGHAYAQATPPVVELHAHSSGSTGEGYDMLT